MVHKLKDKYALDCAAQTWERLAQRRERDIEVEDLIAMQPCREFLWVPLPTSQLCENSWSMS